MLLLMFRAGENLYAVDARRVVEVVPRVALRGVPHAPNFLAGLLGYRGGVVPVVDFSLLTGAPASRDVLSTRIVLVEAGAPGGPARVVGLAAEEVSHVARVEDRHAVSPVMALAEAPYLGAVVRLDEGLVQLVVPEKLLDGRLRDALFGGPTEAA